VFGDAVQDGEAAEDGPGTGEAATADDTAECLEIAWEVLDVCRVILSKVGDRDSQVCGDYLLPLT
jgi:hypothetical protein